ncbi:extracellular solute-binding protein [Ruminococcaceae bacterium OttesenSCG-928-L11]|nr:extracellular solute-binding protein [Ruminococcaceae bacterium OttesenSCG-928-L11]
MKRKSLSTIIIGLGLVLSAFSGCSGGQSNTPEASNATPPSASSTAASSSQTAPATADPVTLKMLLPPSEPKMLNEMLEIVNEKLEADKNINLDIQFIEWDVWQQKINLMLTTGEEFDIFHVMQDRITLSSYQSMGGLADITDAVQTHGQNMLKSIDDVAWSSATINGRVYGVPVMWCELASEGVMTLRQDMLDKYNLKYPETNADLLDITEQLMKQWEGADKPYLMFNSAGAAIPLSSHTTVLHREYDSFPFAVKDTIAYITMDGEVKSWIETDEFKKDCDWFRDAYNRGLINPDVLSVPKEQVDNQRSMGSWAVYFGTGGSLSDIRKNQNPDMKDEEMLYIKLHPEKQSIRYINVKNFNGISSTSKHVDEAVKFFDWLYTDQDNYNLFLYGVEDETYTLVDGKTRTAIRDENNTRLYQISDWMMGNVNFILPDASTPSLQLPVLYEIDENAVNHISADFFFDATPVETEFANLNSEFSASIAPIYLGVQSYDEHFPAALAKMKAAGLDTVLEEYQRQLDAFVATKG